MKTLKAAAKEAANIIWMTLLVPIVLFTLKLGELMVRYVDRQHEILKRREENPDQFFEDWGVRKENSASAAKFFRIKRKASIALFAVIFLTPFFVPYSMRSDDIYTADFYLFHMLTVVVLFGPAVIYARRCEWKAACIESGKYTPFYKWHRENIQNLDKKGK